MAAKTGKAAEARTAAAAAVEKVAAAAAVATGSAATATAAAWGRGGGEHAEAVVALVKLVDGWVWELLPAQKKGGQKILANMLFLWSLQLSNDCTCTGSLLQ